MTPIQSIEALEAIYGQAAPKSLEKVVDHLTPAYRRWIEASRFVVLSTVGPEGTDASPRGEDGPVVTVLDEKTLLLPDWFGNNRIDSLRNIVRDNRASLMFMVAGSKNVVRVNGTAVVTNDDALRERFEKRGKLPRTVVVLTIEEAYFQCAKAFMRAAIWGDGKPPEGLPTAGDFLKERDAAFDGASYDEGYEEYAKPRMW